MVLLPLIAALAIPGCGNGGSPRSEVVLATSTSPVDSGLLEELLRAFEAAHPYRVRVEALGSGMAIQAAMDGECDVTLTHSFGDEQQALSLYLTVDRREIMYNRFVIAGPPDDPAGVRGLSDPDEAFRRIMASGSPFLSRGDGSGTHAAEQMAWLRVAGYSQPQNAPWYRLVGKGMAETLLEAGRSGAYTLCDLAVWKVWGDGCGLEFLMGPEDRMVNQYAVMRVNPDAFPDTNEEGARALVDFLSGEEARRLIAAFGEERFGVPLYSPGTK